MNEANHNHPLMWMVITHIRAEAEAYDQTVVGDFRPHQQSCPTVACLGGWGAFLDGRVTADQLQKASTPQSWEFDDEAAVSQVDILHHAQDAFGFTEEEAHTVFSGDPACNWPEQFAVRWARTQQQHEEEAGDPDEERPLSPQITRQRAHIAADYLTWIIANNSVGVPYEDEDDEDEDDDW